MRKKVFLFVLIYSLLVFCVMADEWKVIKSTHFIIHYKKADNNFIDRIKDHLENYYQKITEGIGFTRYDNFWIWENRANIYIYDAKEEYVNVTNQPTWSLGAADAKNKIISTYYGVSEKEFFDKIVLHELVHIIFREFVGFGDNIYLWLDEGVAEFFSKDYSFVVPMMHKVIKENKFIPVYSLPKRSLVGLSDEEIKLFYIESGAIIYYLMKNYSKSNFVGFCRHLRDGKDVERSFYLSYSIKDLSVLNKKVLQYFNDEPRPF